MDEQTVLTSRLADAIVEAVVKDMSREVAVRARDSAIRK
jgi:hypothetical protein